MCQRFVRKQCSGSNCFDDVVGCSCSSTVVDFSHAVSQVVDTLQCSFFLFSLSLSLSLFLCSDLQVCHLMSSPWKILVRLHSVVNIPKDVCVGNSSSSTRHGDTRVFSVIARAVASEGALLPDCAEMHAEFTTHDIVRTPAPTATVADGKNDLLEVKLDGRGERSAAATAEWRIQTPTLQILLLVKERWGSVTTPTTTIEAEAPTTTGVRVAGACAQNLVCDVADVVQRRKLVTHIVGTEMGQIGISFAVAPSDKAGYEQRLTEFLSRHNPSSLHLIESVVRGIPEVDTFTKLYRKYGVVDYERRVTDFFRVYGREHADQIPTLLQQWENREEELMHNLVLDNGPEPDAIDTVARLEAFVKTYGITTATPDVARAVREFGDRPNDLFAALTARYGAEPDPRSYLYPLTFYKIIPELQQKQKLESRGSTLLQAAPSRLGAPEGTLYTNEMHQPEKDQRQPDVQQHQLPKPTTTAVPRFDSMSATTNTSAPTANKAVLNNKNNINTSSSSDLSWDAFCDSLLRCGKVTSDVYYMSEGEFCNMVDEMGYNKPERDALLHQWELRLRSAVREENLTPGDAYYDTAAKEVLDVVGMQQLNLEVVSVTTAANREHASCF
ncbi:hypothetical protein DQ04_05231050, partial [Trypanosoma grayi]|uniref:hypothetical protein n=1 Tax=Trypanosoma grayi TaxID=71804 RepID=UPI0004F40B4C